MFFQAPSVLYTPQKQRHVKNVNAAGVATINVADLKSATAGEDVNISFAISALDAHETTPINSTEVQKSDDFQLQPSNSQEQKIKKTLLSFFKTSSSASIFTPESKSKLLTTSNECTGKELDQFDRLITNQTTPKIGTSSSNSIETEKISLKNDVNAVMLLHE